MKSLVDLQSHSNQAGSDGTLSVEELVDYILRYSSDLNVNPGNVIWALTDHNTTGGLRGAYNLSEDRGLVFIPGCEVMVYEPTFGNIEILGYGNIDKLNHKEVQEKLFNIRNALESRVETQIKQWYKNGIEVCGKRLSLSLDEYQQLIDSPDKTNDFSVFGSIFAKKLKELTIQGLKIAELNRMFYNVFREPGGELYNPYSWGFPTPEKLISLFTQLGIVSVLAHPGEYHLTEQKRDRLVSELLEMGLDGLEVFSRKNSDNQIRKYLSIKGIIMTGGSDFHKITSEYLFGTYRSSGEIKYIPYLVGEMLYERVNS